MVLLVAGYFILVYSETNVGAEASGYPLELRFDSGGSTGIVPDVRIAGVKVGSVIDQHFDEQAYQAVVNRSRGPREAAQGYVGGRDQRQAAGSDNTSC